MLCGPLAASSRCVCLCGCVAAVPVQPDHLEDCLPRPRAEVCMAACAEHCSILSWYSLKSKECLLTPWVRPACRAFFNSLWLSVGQGPAASWGLAALKGPCRVELRTCAPVLAVSGSARAQRVCCRHLWWACWAGQSPWQQPSVVSLLPAGSRRCMTGCTARSSGTVQGPTV